MSGPTPPVAVLIPAYRPDASLLRLVTALAGRGVNSILIVDDGSGPDYEATFSRLAGLDCVRLIRHPVNLGKGAALKTGMAAFLAEPRGLFGVVTADADGQHRADDIVSVCEQLALHPDSLVLGARAFSGDVPMRSRFGNFTTRGVLHLLLGCHVTDTQTGLRGIPSALMPQLLALSSTRYEFEMEMLVAARHRGVPIVEQSIATIYEPGNPTSHFRPLRDSARIYFVLLRFTLLSLMTSILDNLVFYVVFHASGGIAISQIAARTAAVLFNYKAARNAVFFSDQKHSIVLPRYLALVAVNAVLSYLSIRFLTARFPIGVFPAKVLSESLLFIANFAIQRDFIFTRTRSPEAPAAGCGPDAALYM